jgi:regulator of PEP synthase PpsR (kinase-PPPase family)
VQPILIGVEDSMGAKSLGPGQALGGRQPSPQSPSLHSEKHFHLHLVSDASGETLTTIAKAAVVQLAHAKPSRHMHPLVRNARQLHKVIEQIEASPGIVLYTLMNPELARLLESRCAELGLPCVPVLAPVLKAFEDYLKMPSRHVVAGQHMLDADYFRRIEAMDFTLAHDDGQSAGDLDSADIVLVGASRTSKTPTCIYLANRGYKSANVSLVRDIPPPPNLAGLRQPLVVGLIASPERIADIRKNRMLSMNSGNLEGYVDAELIKQEMALTRRLCAQHRWPLIDVTKKSIEETAATIIAMTEERRQGASEARPAARRGR